MRLTPDISTRTFTNVRSVAMMHIYISPIPNRPCAGSNKIELYSNLWYLDCAKTSWILNQVENRLG